MIQNMPYHIEQSGCPEGKPYAVVGPDGKVFGCHKSKVAAKRQVRALYANESDKKEHLDDVGDDIPLVCATDEQGLPKSDLRTKTPIKREAGMDFSPRDYAYVPDPLRPATWRLRLTEAPGQVSLEQVQRAAAAISPAGFRGNRLEIPPAAASSVKRRLLAEFRRLKVNEAEIPISVKEVTDDSFMTWKDKKGHLRWFAVYSNNFRDDDNPPEILSEQSHLSYVDLVDSGIVDYPELWLWHIPGTEWGKADWVAYADGFAMASGIVYEGFEHIADALMQREDTKVSHGMPNPLLVFDPRYEKTTIFHVTTEISPLPDFAAANSMTGFAILGKGDITMSLPKEKKQYLEEVGLGSDVIARIEANLANARQVATDAGIESKEISDPEDEEELGDDGDLADDEDAEEDEDEPETEPVAAKAKKGQSGSSGAGKPTRRKKPDDDEEEDKGTHGSSGAEGRRRKKPKRDDGKGTHGSSGASRKEVGEPDYATREEVAEAVSVVIGPIATAIKQLGGLVETMSKEISRLSATDEEKIAHTKEVTPTLSLVEMIMGRNPIGKEMTRVKGSTTLGKDGPSETKAPVPQATMVPLINGFIEGMYQQVSQDDES